MEINIPRLKVKSVLGKEGRGLRLLTSLFGVRCTTTKGTSGSMGLFLEHNNKTIMAKAADFVNSQISPEVVVVLRTKPNILRKVLGKKLRMRSRLEALTGCFISVSIPIGQLSVAGMSKSAVDSAVGDIQDVCNRRGEQAELTFMHREHSSRPSGHKEGVLELETKTVVQELGKGNFNEAGAVAVKALPTGAHLLRVQPEVIQGQISPVSGAVLPKMPEPMPLSPSRRSRGSKTMKGSVPAPVEQAGATLDLSPQGSVWNNAPESVYSADSHEKHNRTGGSRRISWKTSPSGAAGRVVVIDGSNVAVTHGNGAVFSSRGLLICVEYWLARGARPVAVIPEYRMTVVAGRQSPPVIDQEILRAMHTQGQIMLTPHKTSAGGTRTISYDDRYILTTAAKLNGLVVSNDNYRDIQHEDKRLQDIATTRRITYATHGPLFIPEEFPNGKAGVSLDDLLIFKDQQRKGNGASSPARKTAAQIMGESDSGKALSQHRSSVISAPHSAQSKLPAKQGQFPVPQRSAEQTFIDSNGKPALADQQLRRRKQGLPVVLQKSNGQGGRVQRAPAQGSHGMSYEQANNVKSKRLPLKKANSGIVHMDGSDLTPGKTWWNDDPMSMLGVNDSVYLPKLMPVNGRNAHPGGW